MLKIAGQKEAKKAKGINWDYAKKELIENGEVDPLKIDIDYNLINNQELPISDEKISLINEIEMSTSSRKRVNELEASIIIIGAALKSSSYDEAKDKLNLINWYLEFTESYPGSMKLSNNYVLNIENLINSFDKIFNNALDEKNKSDEKIKTSIKDEYKSNHIVKELSDGWRVVYLPAAKEMEEYPGIPNSSYDRIVEGNKNGLCIGSRSRMMQDNSKGKIYSVRDPNNNPMATIRILKRDLEEIKGKNNLPPNIETSQKVIEWLDTVNLKNYRETEDYKSLPPVTKAQATSRFFNDPESAYLEGWITKWYGKGIKPLDNDLDRKLNEGHEDIYIYLIGLDSRFFERSLLSMKLLCDKYIKNNKFSNILFNSKEGPSLYKKTKEMKDAVEMFSKRDPNAYILKGLNSIAEFKNFSDKPVLKYIHENPISFIDKFYSETPNANSEYVKYAIKIAIKKEPYNFYKTFVKNSDIFIEYIDDIANELFEKDEISFIFEFGNDVKFKKHTITAINNIMKGDLNYFIKKSLKNKNKLYINDEHTIFSSNHDENSLTNFDIKNFDYQDLLTDIDNLYIRNLGNKSIKEYIKDNSIKTSSLVGKKLIKLSKFLNKNNMKKELIYLKILTAM